MKIYTVGFDQLMINELKQRGYEVIATVTLPKPEVINQSGNIICITSDEISLTDIEQLKQDYDQVQLVYKLHEASIKSTNQAAMICKLYDITFLAPNATVDTLLNLITKEEVLINNNIIGFFGSKAGIGTTSIAKLYAREAANTGAKVLLLGLNLFDEGHNGLEKLSLTDFKPKLNHLLQESDLSKIAKIDNYYYLIGNTDPLLVEDYKPEEIEYLLEFVRSHFDLVIADFGAIPNTAAWYVGVQKSDIRYMVTTEKSIHRLNSLFNLVQHLEISPEDFSLIINDNLEEYTANTYAQRVSSPVVMKFKRPREELQVSKKEVEEIKKQISIFVDVKEQKKGALFQWRS